MDAIFGVLIGLLLVLVAMFCYTLGLVEGRRREYRHLLKAFDEVAKVAAQLQQEAQRGLIGLKHHRDN